MVSAEEAVTTATAMVVLAKVIITAEAMVALEFLLNYNFTIFFSIG